MPILDIEIVGPLPLEVKEGLATRIADAAGEALSSRPNGTWVKLRFLPISEYAENAGGPPEGVLPVIVRVLEADLPSSEALAKRARDLTNAVALACSRPAENVHLIYEPAARGRVVFGGQLRS